MFCGYKSVAPLFSEMFKLSSQAAVRSIYCAAHSCLAPCSLLQFLFSRCGFRKGSLSELVQEESLSYGSLVLSHSLLEFLVA